MSTIKCLEDEYKEKIKSNDKKEKVSINNKKLRIINKHKSIVIKGSICNECKLEYSKENIYLFHFHHLNPHQKTEGLNDLFKLKWSTRIEEELKKCILLCSNCHLKIHFYEDNTPYIIKNIINNIDINTKD